MQDRVPTPGQEGRVLITPENGGTPFYATVTMADNPSVEGTPWAVLSVLQDATAAAFGLSTDAVPDDVFAFLGKYAQHWWRRRTFTYVPILAAAEDVSIIQAGGKDSAVDVPYSSELSITSLTEFDLKSPTNLSLSYSTYAQGNTLKGKYFRTHKIFGGELISEDIFYMAPDASNVNRSSGTGYAVIGMAAKVSIATQYGEDYEYVQSSDRNAYPDSGEQDGYEYQYLGVPLENAVSAPNIETGSYFGTGTYGADNPNSLTFGISAKLVIINKISGGVVPTQVPNYYFAIFTPFSLPETPAGNGYSYTFMPQELSPSGNANAGFSQKTLTWYNAGTNNPDRYQFNEYGAVYRYLAIG